MPTIAAPTNLSSLVIDSTASLNLNSQTLTLSDNLAALGPITGGGIVTLTKTSLGTVRGSVDATLLIGVPDQNLCRTATPAYTVTGSLTATALGVHCPLEVKDAVDVTVKMNLDVDSDSGKLVQSAGNITVEGNTKFGSKATSTFSGGKLHLLGNLDHPGTLVPAIIADAAHVTRLSGTAAQSVVWNPLDLETGNSRFGVVEIDNPQGVTLSTGPLQLLPFDLEELRVLPDRKLTINGGSTGGLTIAGSRFVVGAKAEVAVLDTLSTMIFSVSCDIAPDANIASILGILTCP
jgi:hypothetical protein